MAGHHGKKDYDMDKRRLYKTAKLTEDFQGIAAGTYIGIRFSYEMKGVAHYVITSRHYFGTDLPETKLTDMVF